MCIIAQVYYVGVAVYHVTKHLEARGHFFLVQYSGGMAGVPISETESSDRLSESKADETEISGTPALQMVKCLDFHRNVRSIHVATGRSTISVFHGRLTQRKGLLMHSVCPVVEISAWLRVVLKI